LVAARQDEERQRQANERSRQQQELPSAPPEVRKSTTSLQSKKSAARKPEVINVSELSIHGADDPTVHNEGDTDL